MFLFKYSRIYIKVMNAPPGAQAGTLDVVGAYRTVPTKPDHKRYTVIHFEGFFYIDHNVPFGVASAHGLQGEIADATVDIWRGLGVKPVVKWVDDFNPFRFPTLDGAYEGISDGVKYRYDYDLTRIKHIISPLGIPWHGTKGQEFGDTFAYIGFEWNLPRKCVYLSEKKRVKHLTKVIEFMAAYTNTPAPRKAVESLIGSLSHISFVYRRGSSYLRNLIAWLTTFVSQDDFQRRWPPHSVQTELRWWANQLSLTSFIRYLHPKGPTADYDIWVDASTGWGIGILWNGRWDAWRTTPLWKAKGRDIGWLESVAIELVIRVAEAHGIKDQDFLIRSDNEGAIGAYRKGRSRNFESNLCVRRSEEILDRSNLSITLLYVETSTNLSDCVSRGDLPPASERLDIPYSFPSELSPYFTHV